MGERDTKLKTAYKEKEKIGKTKIEMLYKHTYKRKVQNNRGYKTRNIANNN